MQSEPCVYDGRKFPSRKDLWMRCCQSGIPYHLFNQRVKRGWQVNLALETPAADLGKRASKTIVYEGVQYRSARQFYLAMKKRYAQRGHRKLGITYTVFLQYLRETSEDEAIKRLVSKPYHREDRDLKSSSQSLGGADNLVCQRMTKLGWSYEKAVNTPRNTKSLPKKCRWKGKLYPSINACWKAVKPGISIPKFTLMLKRKGLIE